MTTYNAYYRVLVEQFNDYGWRRLGHTLHRLIDVNLFKDEGLVPSGTQGLLLHFRDLTLILEGHPSVWIWDKTKPNSSLIISVALKFKPFVLVAGRGGKVRFGSTWKRAG